MNEITKEKFKQALCAGKILPYEQNLIDNLREKNYMGMPLSIIVLCFEIANGNCYPTAINLTRGMDKFTLVYGNTNAYPKADYPNHSWVEKDGYVYDPTDGIKYEKSVYYEIYEPEVIETYDEVTCKYNKKYQEVLSKSSDINLKSLSIILTHIEDLEKEKKCFNNMLLQEIEVLRKKYNIHRVDDILMQQFRNNLKQK